MTFTSQKRRRTTPATATKRSFKIKRRRFPTLAETFFLYPGHYPDLTYRNTHLERFRLAVIQCHLYCNDSRSGVFTGYLAILAYRCNGLPAGPISNSGDDIMDATVNAPKTDYMYFFSDLQKEFHFARTAEEFVQLQKQFPWQ